MKRSASRVTLLAVAALLTLALVSSGCSKAQYSDSAAQYIPKKVGDEKVDISNQLALSFKQELEREGSTDVAVAAVGKGPGNSDSALPSALLAAAKIPPNKPPPRLPGELGGGNQKGQETVDGVKVDLVEGKNKSQPAIGYARPKPDILLVAFSTADGKKGVLDAMHAMLSAGRI